MARSDLLIALIKAGRGVPDPRFRRAVEALIAEERAKKHDLLADQLAAALAGPGNGQSLQTLAPSPVADLYCEVSPRRTLDDLVLPSGVLQECQQLVEEHHRADLLRSYSLAPRHRVLLVGPPGNGKTSLAEALAHSLMIPMLAVRYEGLIGSYLGETAARLRRLFDYVRQRACLLFFDEFDTLGKERGDEHETGEIKRVVSTLLLQIDTLPPHVVIVTATNHRELLDRAVWRRFELRLELSPPNLKQIEQFLIRAFSKLEFKNKLFPAALATSFKGASYSEIEAFVSDLARRYVLALPSADVKRITRERLAAWRSRVVPRSR